MTVLETLLVYVGAPVALYAGIWLLVASRRRGKRTRWSAGDPWRYEPLFWIANPAGDGHADHHHADHPHGAVPAGSDHTETRGGTGGKW
ncbi:aa3-type cytochrome oxidase subunit CtaJ [Pseudonocardia phyllosphaerae]|uniref:aa3-type cytochrome oxidase subunit CtaJ n=1 Tax=Pseudonocardia phyllosphaerae TaxID=3390502 RepID=UPI00397CD234